VPTASDSIDALCDTISASLARASLDEYRAPINELMRILDDEAGLYGIPPVVLGKAYQTLMLCMERRGQFGETDSDLREFLVRRVNQKLDCLKRVKAELAENRTAYKLRGFVEAYVSKTLDTKGEALAAMYDIVSRHLKHADRAEFLGSFDSVQPIGGVEGLHDLFDSLPQEFSCFRSTALTLFSQKDSFPAAVVSHRGEFWIQSLDIEVDCNRRSRAIHVYPESAIVAESFIQAVEVARKVAYGFLGRHGRKPNFEDFSVTITLPGRLKTFRRIEGRSAELAIALTIVGRCLGFDSPPGSIASGYFDLGTPQEYLQRKLYEPYNDTPVLQSFDNPGSLEGKVESAVAEGYHRFVYPRDSLPDRGKFAGAIAVEEVTRFEDAIEGYFGDQWRAWKREQLSGGWIRPTIFVDRLDALKEAREAVHNNRITVLHGLSGVGKTLLARQLREAIKDQFNDTELLSIGERGSQNTPVHFYRCLASFLSRRGYYRLSDALNNEDAHLTDRLNWRLVEIAVAELTREPYLLIIDNVEEVLEPDRRVASSWLPFFKSLMSADLNGTRIILITRIEIQSDFVIENADSKEIGGFNVEEAEAFFQQLEDRRLPAESSYERICGQRVFRELLEATEGNPTALMYVFALHCHTRISYSEILADRENYLVSDRSLKLEKQSFNIRHLLRRLFDLLSDDYRGMLRRFSVYRRPVKPKAFESLDRHWFPAAQQLEAFFLLEELGGQYQLYPLAKDLAHIELRRNYKEYAECHSKAAGFYLSGRTYREGYSYRLDEAIYHYSEAGNWRKATELSITHPSLSRAENARRGRDFPLAVDQYEKYIGYVGDGVSSKTLADYAYCVEKCGDREKAAGSYKKAIDLGNISALGRLARLYLESADLLEDLQPIGSANSAETEFDDWEGLRASALHYYEAAVKERCEDYEFYLAFYKFFRSCESSKATDTFRAALQNLSARHYYHDRARFFIEAAKYHEQKEERDIALDILRQAREGEFAVARYEDIYLAAADLYDSAPRGFGVDSAADYTKAIDVLLTGARNTERNSPRHRGKIEYKLADIYIRDDDYREARKWLEKSIRISAENPAAHLRLAELTLIETKKDAEHSKDISIRDRRYGEALIHLHEARCSAHSGQGRRERVLRALNRIYSVSPILSECITFAKWCWEPTSKTRQPETKHKKSLRASANDHWRYLVHDQSVAGRKEVLADADVEKYLKTLRSGTSEELYESFKALGKSEFPDAHSRGEFIIALIDRFHSTGDSILLKSCIIVALGRLRATEAVLPLSRLLQEQDPKLSCLDFLAAWSLKSISVPECQPALRRALQRSQDPLVRLCAVEASGVLQDESCLEDLIELYERDITDTNTRLATIRALGNLRSLGARDYVDGKFKGGGGELIKLAAAIALSALGRIEALNYATQYLAKNGNTEDRRSLSMAAFALGNYLQREASTLAEPDQRALEVLSGMAFSSEDNDVSLLGRKGLAMACRKRENIDFVFNTLLPANNYKKSKAASFLGELGSEDATALLPRFLFEDDAIVQEAAIKSIGRLGHREAIPSLTELACTSPTYSTRKLSAATIEKLGGEAPSDIGRQCAAKLGRVEECPNVSREDSKYCERHQDYKPDPTQLYGGARPRARSTNVRIYDLAKELKLDNKRVMEDARLEGVNVTVPFNTIPFGVAQRIALKHSGATAAGPPRPKVVLKASWQTPPIESSDQDRSD
jgi:HEAT repeat protein